MVITMLATADLMECEPWRRTILLVLLLPADGTIVGRGHGACCDDGYSLLLDLLSIGFFVGSKLLAVAIFGDFGRTTKSTTNSTTKICSSTTKICS